MPKLVRNPKRYALSSYYPSAQLPKMSIPALRKISEESICSNSESSMSSDNGSGALECQEVPLMNLTSMRKISRSSSSLSCLLDGDSANLEVASTTSRTTCSTPLSLRLKRPAPSACLVDLASNEAAAAAGASTVNSARRNSNGCYFASPAAAADFCDVTPPPLRRDSNDNGGWGYFVDMMIPNDSHSYEGEEDDTNSNAIPQQSLPFCLQPGKRRRIQPQVSLDLPGFFLAVPTVDDAAFQLSSLTF